MKLIFLFLLPLALGMEPEAEPAATPLPPDYNLMGWMQGDEELDNWVRDTYG
eukprot:SAG11_NODE_6161_length_1373_cov_5.088697_2_plen_51_part_01